MTTQFQAEEDRLEGRNWRASEVDKSFLIAGPDISMRRLGQKVGELKYLHLAAQNGSTLALASEAETDRLQGETKVRDSRYLMRHNAAYSASETQVTDDIRDC